MMGLKNIMIEITNECNRKCPICEASIGIRPIKHLPQKAAIDIIKLLSDNAIESISFTGGEPLSRWNELIELLELCKKRNLATRLYTNGILLNENRINTLAKLLNDIVVSFDSNNHEINLEIRNDLLFDKVRNNIISLSHSSINVYVISVCSSININDLSNNVDFLNNINIKGWMIQQFIPNGIGKLHKSIFEVSANTFENKIGELRNVSKIPILSYAYNAIDTKRVFINCEGIFIDYKSNTSLGSALNESTINKILNSKIYKNKKRTI